MTFEKTNLVYFSATGTTAKIVSAIESGMCSKHTYTYQLLSSIQETIIISNNELVVFGIPVFSGRVPDIVRKALEQVKGNNTPAILACVYGNRDFEDALLELKTIVENNGFYVLSAGAFIGQHSIFPQVGQGRPDASDLAKAKEFGTTSIQGVDVSAEKKPLPVKGNYPYRTIKPIPLKPRTNKQCNACGLCSKKCPTEAIDFQNPQKTDKNKCISCAHCIAVCPKQAKSFGGLLYWLVSKKFTKDNSERKEPYLVYR